MCNPSRAAVLTGLGPSTTGIYGNETKWLDAFPNVATIPQHFKANGYHVVGGGKVNHHMPGFNRRSDWHDYFDQVFDSHYQDQLARGLDIENFAWPTGFPLNRLDAVKTFSKPPQNANEFDWGALDKPDREMGDGKMVEWAVKFLAQPQISNLAIELRPWASGEASVDTLAAFMERYEATGALHDADAIAELRLRMKWSADPRLQALAEDLNRHYRNANMRVAFSGELMNRMIPPQEVRKAPVRSRIVGADVRGRSETDTEVAAYLIDPE